MAMLGQGSATPILDLEAPLPLAKRDSGVGDDLIVIAVIVAWGVAIQILTKYYAFFHFFRSLLVLFLVFLTTTAIHETGHLVAGLIVGFRLDSVAVGPLCIERNRGRWRLRIRRALFNGVTFMLLDRIWRVRRRLIFFVAGGPAATGLSAGMSLAIMGSLHDDLKVLAGLFAFVSGLQFLMNLIPIRWLPSHDGVLPDGVGLRTLVTSKEGTRQLIAAMALDLLRNNNVDRLRWNPRWTKAAHGKAALSGQGFVHDWNAYASAGTAAIKAEHLERCLAASGSLAPEGREQVIVEAAYFTAWWRDNAAKADVWLARVARPENVSRYSLMRAEVALHCAHRQFDKALDCWERGLVWLQSLPEPWVRRFEHGWREWRAEVEKRRAERSLAEQTSATQQA